jgi:hypothetical protein
MLRIPEPKEQARLLSSLLAEQGLGLQHQKALDIVARLHGHRNWNVMQAAPAAVAPAPVSESLPGTFVWKQRLVDAAENVVNSADDTGCTDDLTVTSSEAVEALRQALMHQEPADDSQERTVGGFNVEDVHSVRPDLTDEEAEEVLSFCEKYFDASRGLTWDIIEEYSFQCLGLPYGVEAVLKYADGESQAVVVQLYSGRMFPGTLESLEVARTARTHVDTDFSPLPQGCELVFGDGKISVDMAGDWEVNGGSTEDLHQLCQELREAGISFEKTGR